MAIVIINHMERYGRLRYNDFLIAGVSLQIPGRGGGGLSFDGQIGSIMCSGFRSTIVCSKVLLAAICIMKPNPVTTIKNKESQSAWEKEKAINPAPNAAAII
jgi:hypothetical protein